MTALGDFLNSLEVLIAEDGDLEVALNTRGGRALGEHDVATAKTPGEQDLGKVVTAALGDGLEERVVADTLARRWDLVLRAEGRVGGRDDLVLEAELDELGVGHEGVDLDLVDGGLDAGELEELLQALDGPVGNTDGPCLAGIDKILHGPPCWLGVLGELLLDDVLAIGADLGHVVLVLLGGDGPVDEEEVDVVNLELVERVLQAPLDVLGLVQVVPDLGADEDVLALDVLVVLEELGKRLADLILVLVEPRAVKVTVADLKGLLDGSIGLALGTLVGKGAESDGGNSHSIVECVVGVGGGKSGHFGVCDIRDWQSNP